MAMKRYFTLLAKSNISTASQQTPTNEYPVYDYEQSDIEALEMLEVWGMRVI